MNRKLNLFLSVIIIILTFNLSLKAQEILIPLDGNPVLQDYKQPIRNKASKAIDTLELPFFDDFSTSNIYPDQTLWADEKAYINGSYAVNPPSIGVATLDAIDSIGEFYPGESYGNSFSADSLTSNPINLNYPGNKTIYLSFFYQPQGRGDAPETGDSLILEFYAPQAKIWNNVWNTPGGLLTKFKQVMIPIIQDQYLKKGFRFRFRNIVSLSSDQQPSKAVNADHWSIDYIKLDKNRNQADTIYHDMAFVYPMVSVLKNYESMPWKHFLVNRSAELSKNVSSVLHNNDNIKRLVKSIYWVFYDQSGKEINDTLTGGAYNIPAGNDSTINPPFLYPFITSTTDSASFRVKAQFNTDGFDYKPNNEMTYIQKFYDYYAYDDGSAEAGYGLIGEGTQNALLAYKFDCKKQDTLKAIQMYFTRSLNNKSQNYFYLTIWDDNGGKPGNIIYHRKGIRPEYENGLNKFHTYYIDDTTIVLNRVFYVGWQQTTPDLLNIGFDFNRNRSSNIFYNVNGTWQNSSFEGALMIRPFFGKMITTGILPEYRKINPQVKIYPNPVNDELTIQIDKPFEYKNITISIYNLSGSLVQQSIQNNNTTINLSNLKEGMYIIRLTDKTNSLNFSCKILKQRN